MSKSVFLRTSERGSFKRCRQQWWWSYVDQLKPKQTPHALMFGDLIHQCLAAYYKPGRKRGPRPATTWRKLYKAHLLEAEALGFRDEEGKWRDAGDLGEAMMEGYHERYHEADLRYRVISAEQTFRWRLPNGLTYVGTFDGVWEDMERDRALILPEHKTTSKIAKHWDHLEFDEQASAYWTYAPAWLVKQGILDRSDLKRFLGIQYNFLRKALPDKRETDAEGYALNQDGSRSKVQPSPLFVRPPLVYRDESHRRRQHERIQAEAAEMRAVRAGELVVYKNPGPLYMPNCSGCGFREMCALHEMGADWEAFRDGTMGSWEPYEAHNLDPHGDVVT